MYHDVEDDVEDDVQDDVFIKPSGLPGEATPYEDNSHAATAFCCRPLYGYRLVIY